MALSKNGLEARNNIISAFRRLDIAEEKWSPLIGPEPALGKVTRMPAENEYFKPPVFDRFQHSPEEWKTLADVAWQKHRDKLMERWLSWERMGVDEPVPRRKQRRHRGTTGRNAGLDQRYEWAALRLLGEPWKEIAVKYLKCLTEAEVRKAENTVRKAATELLGLAHLGPTGNKDAES